MAATTLPDVTTSTAPPAPPTAPTEVLGETRQRGVLPHTGIAVRDFLFLVGLVFLLGGGLLVITTEPGDAND